MTSLLCDHSPKILLVDNMTLGKRVKNCPKLRDDIYGRPQSTVNLWSTVSKINLFANILLKHLEEKNKTVQSFAISRIIYVCLKTTYITNLSHFCSKIFWNFLRSNKTSFSLSSSFFGPKQSRPRFNFYWPEKNVTILEKC